MCTQQQSRQLVFVSCALCFFSVLCGNKGLWAGNFISHAQAVLLKVIIYQGKAE